MNHKEVKTLRVSETLRVCGRWLLALLALAVPVAVEQYTLLQWHHPVPEFLLFWHEPSVVYRVIPGGGAEAAGVRAGDVILTVNGAPFIVNGFPYPPASLQVGQTVTLGIERDGQRLELDVPFVPAAKALRSTFILPVIFSLAFWIASILLLWRRFWQIEARLLFLLAQTLAIVALFPSPDFAPWYPPSIWQVNLSGVCFFLSASFLLHYHVTFPVVLGTPRQRRWGLSLLYGLKLVVVAGWLMTQAGWLPYWMWQVGGAYIVLEVTAAVIALIYVYFRRATPDGRRRLRLIILGNILTAGTTMLLYVVPAIARGFTLIPEWLLLLCLLIAPLAYFYATVRHSLFGIDRLLNRALAYVLLSLGILILYLGPFLLLYRSLPGNPLAQMLVVAGLTLLVGLGFNWTRARVQQLVDRLFYGGWYDFQGVVEAVSEALSRSLEREQLQDVLTRQVPGMMQLQQGHLWIGEPGAVPPQGVTPLQMQFPLVFQGQVRGLWTAGPRLDGDALSATDWRILRTLAHQAEVALSNVLLVETLRRQLEEVREAQHQLLRSREEERARVARDLHDGPIQSLVGLNMQLGLLRSPSREADTPLAGELGAMRTEVRNLLAELRQVCAELRPPMLDTLGLGAALRALAEDWSAQNGITVHLELSPDAEWRSLPDEAAVNLYRVMQEALANVARHAAARQVILRLAWEDAGLSLTVQDDGRGFAVPAALHSLSDQGHLGLVGIQERVNLIGGTLTLESAPGQGTTLRVVWQGDAD